MTLAVVKDKGELLYAGNSPQAAKDELNWLNNPEGNLEKTIEVLSQYTTYLLETSNGATSDSKITRNCNIEFLKSITAYLRLIIAEQRFRNIDKDYVRYLNAESDVCDLDIHLDVKNARSEGGILILGKGTKQGFFLYAPEPQENTNPTIYVGNLDNTDFLIKTLIEEYDDNTDFVVEDILTCDKEPNAVLIITPDDGNKYGIQLRFLRGN